MKNIKLTLAYDGTDYHGFQEQRGTKFVTIQEVLEKSLSNLAKKPIKVIGAGRTDAGVHARGQVVNFRCERWPVPVKKVPLAVNSRLPRDVVVTMAEEVDLDFHARYSAIGKTYIYTIHNAPIPDPFLKRFAYHEPRSLDHRAMDKAARFLEGEHDFKSFQAQGNPVKTTVRKMTQARVEGEEDKVYIQVTANGFLYNMVRIIAGTLILVGLNKISPEDIKEIINSKERSKAGATVPPQGLHMEKVYY